MTHNDPDITPTPTNELLELAVIDALGLLDDEDRAAFDAGFRAAPATLRELIRAEQARIAAGGELLPDVEVPEALRERILNRIKNEIARKHASPKTPKAFTESRAVSHQPTPRPPRLQRARRVSPAWRITAVALAVATVVLGVLQVQLKQKFNAVSDGAQLATLLDTVGVEHIEATLFDASSMRVQFQPVGNVGNARATLWHKPDSNEARIYIWNFTNQSGYKLVVLDQNDNPTEELGTFEADSLLSIIDVNINKAGQVRLAIITDENNPQTLFVAEVKLS